MSNGPPVDPNPTFSRWFSRGILAAALLASAIAVSPNVADPDLWGHVEYGRDVLEEGLARETTYSFTATRYRWINHENLAELLLAIGADRLGPIGLMVGKCLLGGLVLSLIMRAAWRQGVGLLTACVIPLLVAVNLGYHWSLRPQILSFTCFALLLQLLSFAFHGWEGRWQLNRSSPLQWDASRLRALWLAPPLFFVWANSHGGFVAGFCIFAAYLGLRGLEALVRNGRQSWGLQRRFALMIAAALAATAVNPYSWDLHLWLLRSLGQARPEITEWHAPELFAWLAVPLWLLLASLAGSLVFSRRSLDFTHLAVLGLTMWQSLEHQRHIPFFAIAFGFWMPIHFQSWLSRWGASNDRVAAGEAPAAAQWALCAGLCLTLALLSARLVDRLRDVRVDRSEYPVAALQFMQDEQIGGNLVVTYNWAQYVIGAFGDPDPERPQVRVAFDGRFRTCYPQNVVDMHFDFILGDLGDRLRSRGANSPAFDAARVLDYGPDWPGRPDLALVNRKQPHGELVLRQRDDWVLLYEDTVAQLWGRAATFDDPVSPRYLPPSRRRHNDAPQRGFVSWPALPTRSSGTAGPPQLAAVHRGHPAAATASNTTVSNTTVSNATASNATVSNATVSNATVSNATAAATTASGATASGATVSNATASGKTVSDAALTDTGAAFATPN